MNRLAPATVSILLAISLCHAQTATPAPQTSPAATASSPLPGSQSPGQNPELRGAFPTALSKSIDSNKLKDGDTIVCRTTAVLHTRSGITIPNGTKVFGHVTQATARSKGDSDSSLAMTFDKIEMPNGKELSMKGVLQAVGPGLMGNSGPDTGAAGSGTLPNGRGADLSTMPPPSPTAVTGPNSEIRPLNGGSRPILNAQSVGVLGLHNLQMNKESVLTSSGKEVKLDSGTQMMIRAEIQLPGE
jgi:hypothetical protein